MPAGDPINSKTNWRCAPGLSHRRTRHWSSTWTGTLSGKPRWHTPTTGHEPGLIILLFRCCNPWPFCLRVQRAQPRRDLLAEQPDVLLGVRMVEETALPKRQQMPDASHPRVEVGDLRHNVVRRPGEY